MAGSTDDDLDPLRAARPAQDDPIARRLEARVRAALVGGDVAPARIDRFEVLERLGTGGMGVVYAAFDPRLDRRVAIKVLHAGGDFARARVIAEARALARLTHPNVVAVYDATDLGDQQAITMELVDGPNLRRWLAAGPRPVAQVIDAMAAAGAGLAAAHAVGLVHGDVKPENLLVGAGGAVKVADFGLARADRATLDGGKPRASGTPAYMAPELFAGAAPDAHGDQFAFAVTMYEALAGARPYTGATVDELVASTRAGVVAPLPRGVPARVGRALDRALRPDPAARFPSMTALLAALARPAVPRAVLAAAIALTLVVAAGVLGFALTREGAPACDGGERHVALALPPAALDALPARVQDVLAGYAGAWSTQRRLTCAATRDGEQSAAMLDLRMACLDRRLAELAAVARAIGAPGVAEGDAISAAYALPPLEPCADREQLTAIEPPPAAIRAQVAALERRLVDVNARQKTAFRAALADARTLVDDARALGYAPLFGAALVSLGKLQIHDSDAAAAEATLKETIAVATQARDETRVAEAWAARIFVAAFLQGKPREALAYAEAAEAAAARMSAPSLARAQIKTYVAAIQLEHDQYAEARANVEQAIAILEEIRGKDHPIVAESVSTLAEIAMIEGHYTEARALAERSRASFARAYGPAHEDVAVTMTLLAGITVKEGDLERALAAHVAARDTTIAAYGERHVSSAIAHGNVGDLLRKLGRDDEARVELAAARAGFEATTGLSNEKALWVLQSIARLEPDPDNRYALLEDVLARRIELFGETNRVVADTYDDLGNAAKDAKRYDLAAAMYHRAIDTFERGLGPSNPRISVPLSNLGELAIARRRFTEAVEVCARALELDTAALGADHPDLAYDLTCLGEAKLGLRRAADAVPLLERALALRTEGSAAPDELERTQAALERARARAATRR